MAVLVALVNLGRLAEARRVLALLFAVLVATPCVESLERFRPRTTCLYSAASMLLRSLSAASQSLASNPRLAPLPLAFFSVAAFFLPILSKPDFVRAVLSLSPDFLGG